MRASGRHEADHIAPTTPRRGRAESAERRPGFFASWPGNASGAALEDSLCPGVELMRCAVESCAREGEAPAEPGLTERTGSAGASPSRGVDGSVCGACAGQASSSFSNPSISRRGGAAARSNTAAEALLPKLLARRLKSLRFTSLVKSLSPWTQRRPVWPKLLARRLKSARFTRASRFASPYSVWRSSTSPAPTSAAPAKVAGNAVNRSLASASPTASPAADDAAADELIAPVGAVPFHAPL